MGGPSTQPAGSVDDESKRFQRILYLVGGFQIGGTERHLSLVLPRLDRSARNIHIRCLGQDGPLSTPLRKAGLDVKAIDANIRLNLPKLRAVAALWSRVAAVAREIKQLEPDLIHCYLPEPAIIGWLASRITSGHRPLIMSKRSQTVRPEAFPGEIWLEARALKAADYVLGHSTVVTHELQQRGIAPTAIHLIHNGVDLTPFRKTPDRSITRTREGWPSQAVVLVVLANLIPYKGHEDLLAALARLGRSAPDWMAVLIGAGHPEREAFLKNMVTSLGLKDRVIFAGHRTDIPALLGSADIGVLPSHQEGFSNAILEYMAAGLPVVATHAGGNPDAVVAGVTGMLVPPGNPEALAEALEQLRLDKSLRIEMGQSGRERVNTHFNLSRCVEAYEAFYRSLPAPG